MIEVPSVTLNSGRDMPRLGFGVFQVPNEQVIDPVWTALEAGYRSIDTAAAYGNETGVGQAIAESGLSREDLFVTSKLWNDDHGYDAALRAFEATLQRLDMDYLDLYLIHWPMPGQDRFVSTWQAFERLYQDGRVGSIGVSNFQPHHLRRLFDETNVTPAVNQVELHPRLPQPELRAFHAEHGIVTEAWSPIGQGKGLLQDTMLTEIAAKYARTPAQIVLRWHIQLGNVVIPKSKTSERIRENIEVFDFELADDDVQTVTSLATGERVGPNPDVFGA